MPQESEGFPRAVKLGIPEDSYWKGQGRQDMDFHQTLGELIDNAISASGYDEEGDLKPFKIEVTLQRVGNIVGLRVADCGIGFTLSDLEEKVLNPGGKGSSDRVGPLNEHGFGLKNALCTLTGNEKPFKIKTRDIESREHIYLIQGPFRSGMEIDLDNEENWNEGLEYATRDHGSRIYAKTSFHFFNTLYPRAGRFDTLVERLREHLGVMYRGFLGIEYNKLWLRWQNQGDDPNNPNASASWRKKRIEPIEIPYDRDGHAEIRVHITCEGEQTVALYRSGLLDIGKVEDESQGDTYPLKIYYQGNQPTQGIDIRVRNRVIKTGLLPELWGAPPLELTRHNDFNYFVGELILDEHFRTVNNKTAVDPHNDFWERLLDEINSEDFEGAPERQTRSQRERTLKEILKNWLEGYVTNSTVTKDRPVWSGAGVKIDLYHEKPNDIDIYEVKTGTARPQDVYQLVMYWDGLVIDGITPSLGRLVADGAPSSIQEMIQQLNQRGHDPDGNSYNLEFKSIEDLPITY